MFTVLLFYKFVEISDPESLRLAQLKLCRELNLKGRILISKEGINGTVAGEEDSCNEYIRKTSEIDGLSDIEWKISHSEIDPFPKLRVVVRDEIVTFKRSVDINNRAEYIEPNELLEMYERDQDFIIIDGRNEYEARIGKFKNAVVPDINNFRDFPKWFEENKDKLIGKKVITYCTGGIRCEKLSAYLIEEGVNDVKQLRGGIHRYGDEVGGKNFEGTMYVFDKRIHVEVNKVNPEIISECLHCKKKIARYINCSNVQCNCQFICCESCEKEYLGGCSSDCMPKSKYKEITK